jgi:hypothetical protein
MNRYMLILWGGGARMARMSPGEIQDHMKHWTTWMEGLSKQGIWDGGEPLGDEAKLVKGAKKPVTDGPYTEAKEAVSGYVILKADTMEKACEISKGCPLFEIDGTVEVRPIRAM